MDRMGSFGRHEVPRASPPHKRPLAVSAFAVVALQDPGAEVVRVVVELPGRIRPEMAMNEHGEQRRLNDSPPFQQGRFSRSRLWNEGSLQQSPPGSVGASELLHWLHHTE